MNNDRPRARKSRKSLMRSKKSCLPGLTFILKARCLWTRQVCSLIPRSFLVPVTGTSNTSKRWCLFLALSLKQSQLTVYHTPPCFCLFFTINQSINQIFIFVSLAYTTSHAYSTIWPLSETSENVMSNEAPPATYCLLVWWTVIDQLWSTKIVIGRAWALHVAEVGSFPGPTQLSIQYSKAGRAWYLFSREHDVIKKGRKFANQKFPNSRKTHNSQILDSRN